MELGGMGKLSLWLFLWLLDFVAPSLGTTTTLVFGQSCPLTGDAKDIGNEFRNGILAAFKEINSENMLSVKLSLISYDDGYDPPTAQNNTLKLIKTNKVFAILGSIGTPTSQLAAPIAIQNNIPFIGAFTGANMLREPFNPLIINVRASYDDETAAMVNYLVSNMLIDRISILYQNDTFGLSGLAGLQRSLQAVNLILESNSTYERNTLNVEKAVRDIYKGNPQAIVMIGTYAPLAKFITLCRARPDFNDDTIFLTVSFVNGDSLIQLLGNHSHNVVITQVVPPPSKTSLSFIRRYQKSLLLWNSTLTPNFVSLEGYLLGRFVAEVLSRMENNITKEKFVDTVFKTSTFRVEGIRLGLYYYNNKFNPEASQEEKDGCNQGMRSIWITSYSPGNNSFEEVGPQYDFHYKCKSDPKTIPVPVVFATVNTNKEIGEHLNRGVQAAFQSIQSSVALSRLKLVLLNINLQNPAIINEILSEIPWGRKIVGYIGNQGLLDTNHSFILQETNAGKVFIGSQSGNMALRAPYNPMIINVRSSIIDELYTISYYLIRILKLKKISLITDTSSESMGTDKVLSNELNANGLFLQQHIKVLQSDSLQTSLSTTPSKVSPEAFVFVGKMASFYNVLDLLPLENALLMFTSLNSVREIKKLERNRSCRILFTIPVTMPVGNEELPIINSFKKDYENLYPDLVASNTNFASFEGYILGTFVTKMVSRISGTITGKDISDLVTSVRLFDLEGVKLGPFSNLPCTENIADQVFGCECNQGMRSVYVYSLNESSIVLSSQGRLEFATCGVDLKEDQLGWDTLSSTENMSLVTTIFVFAGITAVVIVFTFYHYRHPVFVASSSLFSIMIQFGILLGYLSIIPFIGEPTEAKCIAQPTISGLAWITVLGGLIVKNYRIYRIFTNSTGSPVGNLSDKNLLVLFGTLLLVETHLTLFVLAVTNFVLILYILLSLWLIIETPRVSINLRDKWKYCEGGNRFRFLVFGFNITLVLVTTFLSVKTRNAYERFSDTKVLGITSYNLFFMGCILFALILTSSSQQRMLLVSCMILLLNTPTLVVMFGNKIYCILTNRQQDPPKSPSTPMDILSPSTTLSPWSKSLGLF